MSCGEEAPIIVANASAAGLRGLRTKLLLSEEDGVSKDAIMQI